MSYVPPHGYISAIDRRAGAIHISEHPGGTPGEWQPIADFLYEQEPNCGAAVWHPTAGPYTDRVRAYPGGFWPGYLYQADPSKRPTLRPNPAPAPAVARCECGAEKAGCGPGAHSDWCPKADVRP